MSLEKMGQSIESNEVKVRLQATPEDVENVKKSIEYSNHLTKANNVLKVLDYPDNIEESFRKILLKQDNKTLEELSKKSKQEIQTFLIQTQKINIDNLKKTEIQKQEKLNLEDIDISIKNNNKLNRLKSVFTPQILEQNTEKA